MTKIDYKTGTPKEYLIGASIITQGNAEGALDHITTETKKLISTNRIAVTSSDNESVYVGVNTGVIVRMKNNANYSDKIIHLPDLSHKVEKIMFPSATKFKDHSKDERWVLDTCNKTKKVIGCVLTHQKMAKILCEYSDQSDDKNVRFHTFQPFMNVIFCEYLSLSLNYYVCN